RFRLALLEDDAGFRLALRADCRCTALSLSSQTSLFSRGKRLDALAIDLGFFQHSRNQLLLMALDLSFLHLDLAFFLDLLHLYLLSGHLLLHHIGLQLVGLVSLRLLATALLGKLRLLDVEVALRLGLARRRSSLGNHAVLVGLRLGYSRFA